MYGYPASLGHVYRSGCTQARVRGRHVAGERRWWRCARLVRANSFTSGAMKLSVPARVATACASLIIATSPLHAVSIDDATASVGAARSAIAGSGAAESDVAALEAFFSGGRAGIVHSG